MFEKIEDELVSKDGDDLRLTYRPVNDITLCFMSQANSLSEASLFSFFLPLLLDSRSEIFSYKMHGTQSCIFLSCNTTRIIH